MRSYWRGKDFRIVGWGTGSAVGGFQSCFALRQAWKSAQKEGVVILQCWEPITHRWISLTGRKLKECLLSLEAYP